MPTEARDQAFLEEVLAHAPELVEGLFIEATFDEAPGSPPVFSTNAGATLRAHWQQQLQAADAAARLGAPGAESRGRLIEALLRSRERQELARRYHSE